MHNRALHDALAAFAEEAAWELARELTDGAELPFELVEAGRPSAPLYCYRPLTSDFIASRAEVLERLPGYTPVLSQLTRLPGADAYLESHGVQPPRADRRGRAEAVLSVFLSVLWEHASAFDLDQGRFGTAYAELEAAAYDGCSLMLVVAPVEGLVIDADEVLLGHGLALARIGALQDTPVELRGDAYATVAVLAAETVPGEPGGLEAAGHRLRRLQTALRLWDDAEPSIGPMAWARMDGGPWMAIALGGGIRRTADDCLLAPEEEDALRAFCSLVARRTPRAGELAWALRRFELGCERGTAFDALSDWLLAARALLADPASSGHDATVARLAAICASAEARQALVERLGEGVALERAIIAGMVRPSAEVEALVGELGTRLRAVLRDVLCGHLDPDLRSVADAQLQADDVTVALGSPSALAPRG